MAVGIKVDFLWYPIGTGDFLHSFFSTIAINLENGKWGDKFPVVMKEMYQGSLSYENIAKAKKELVIIKNVLAKLSTEKVVWDADDLSKRPPWGNDISIDITNLSNYFITSDGRDLFEVFDSALNEAQNEKLDLTIINL